MYLLGLVRTIIEIRSECVYQFSICSSPETGGITITPRPGPDNNPPKPGFPTRPFWGMEPALLSVEVLTVDSSLG